MFWSPPRPSFTKSFQTNTEGTYKNMTISRQLRFIIVTYYIKVFWLFAIDWSVLNTEVPQTTPRLERARPFPSKKTQVAISPTDISRDASWHLYFTPSSINLFFLTINGVRMRVYKYSRLMKRKFNQWTWKRLRRGLEGIRNIVLVAEKILASSLNRHDYKRFCSVRSC